MDFDWANRFFGRRATLVRQTIVADEGNPDWDSKARPRRVVIDTLDTHRPATLTVYPTDTLYPPQGRPPQPHRAGGSRSRRAGRVLDDRRRGALLTWSLLSFTWTRDDISQRVNLVTVDDHRPDAISRGRRPRWRPDVTNTFNVLIRGNAVTVDDNSEYKDRDMLAVVGTQLVDAQWKADEA